MKDPNMMCTKEMRERLLLSNAIVEMSPVVLFRRLPPPEPKLVFVSDNIKRFGITAEEMLSGDKKFIDLVHPDDIERLRAEITHYQEINATDYTQEYRLRSPDGQIFWVEDSTTTIRDEKGDIEFYQGIVVDVTERKLIDLALKESEEKHRRIVETTGEGYALVDPNLIYQDVNQAFCDMLGYSREEILGKTPMHFASEGFKRFLSINRERLLSQDRRRFEGELQHKDGALIPVLIHGDTLRNDAGEILGNVAFISDLTEQKRSLALARDVQQSLLPKNAPEIKGLDIAGRSIPCDEVGGDYFDFIEVGHWGKDAVTVALGDVSGHGVDSALLMTTARASMRNLAFTQESLKDVIEEMNRSLNEDFLRTNRFMTMIVLRLHSNGEIKWVRAGQDPPLVYDMTADDFSELHGEGIPLGVLDSYDYESNEHTLSPGSIVAAGTDGIWEATNEHNEMFGKERFKEVIRQCAAMPAADILNAVYQAVSTFTKGAPPTDDVTLVIVKLNP